MWHFGFQVAGWPSKRLIKWQLYSIKGKRLWDFPFKYINQSFQRQTIEQFTKCVWLGETRRRVQRTEEGETEKQREVGLEFFLPLCIRVPWLWTFPLCPTFVWPSSNGTSLPNGEPLGPVWLVCVCVCVFPYCRCLCSSSYPSQYLP